MEERESRRREGGRGREGREREKGREENEKGEGETRRGKREGERTMEGGRCMLHTRPQAGSPDLFPGVRCRVDGGDVDREEPHALVGGSQRAVARGATAVPLASQNGAPVLLQAMVELHRLLEGGRKGSVSESS